MTRMTRTVVLLIAAVVTVGLVQSSMALAKDIEIGFIEMTRALNEVEEGQKELGRLEKWQGERRDTLAKTEKDLMDRKDSLQKEEGTLAPDVYRAKVEQYLKDVEVFQKEKMSAAKELQDKLSQSTVYVKRRMDLIIAEIAEREGYYMVVDISEGGVVYYPPSQDITNQVIRLYDKRYPVKGAKKDSPKKGKKK